MVTAGAANHRGAPSSVEGIGAVGDQRMQVHEQSEVVAKALHDDDDTDVQASHGTQRMVCSGPSPHRAHDRAGKHSCRAREQSRVVAESHRHAPGERQHPLPIPDRGQTSIHQQGGAFAHAPAQTRRTDAAALARKGHAELLATSPTCREQEPMLEVTAGDERTQLGRRRRARTRGPRREGPRARAGARDLPRTRSGCTPLTLASCRA